MTTHIEHAQWVDSIAEWAEASRKLTEADLDRAIADRTVLPAECCSHFLADAEPQGFVFPLEPLLTQHTWLGPLMVALIGFVWLCVDGYLAAPY